MKEYNLLSDYSKTKVKRFVGKGIRTIEHRIIASERERLFFDGDRKHGYGGFKYDPKFWQPVIPTFKTYWKLTSDNSLLDVGCGKGFMLFDLYKMIPGINLAGIDISEYAINNSPKDIKKFLSVANAKKLPFPSKSFDVVISINTIHNLEKDECAEALQEIKTILKFR